MTKRQSPITNRILLQHMQTGHEALRTEMIREIRRLDAKIETLKEGFVGLKEDVAELKRNDEKIFAALQRLYERRLEVVEELRDHQPSPSYFNEGSGLRPASEKRIVRLEKVAARNAGSI